MLKRTRRRSAHITLVLLGAAAALAACGDDADRRDLYASKQDCVQDWGDETKCESAPPGTTSSRPHSGGGYFYGPPYSSSRYNTGSTSTGSTALRSGSRAVSSSSFSRGGFGSSSSSHSSSGS